MNEPTWAVVELMGHVRLAGRLSEEEHFGAKMGRLDIPKPPDPKCFLCGGSGAKPPATVGEPPLPCDAACCRDEFTTTFFGGGSVYRITAVTEEVARAVGRRSQPEPVHAWELPKALPAPRPPVDEGEVDDEREHECIGEPPV